MADLWDERRAEHRKAAEPLAARMRPRTLDEFAGQTHFLGPGRLLRRMLKADRLSSVLFYGPPGTGKTTLAELIARHTSAHFDRGNAAVVGVKDVRHVLDGARRRLEQDGRRTLFFLDEIHRFNKSQQDVLLGDVERGVITLIGATTENPYYTVNNALVSRSQVFQFEPLTEDEVRGVLRRAIADPERGFGAHDLTVTDQALRHWATASDGDARRALTALEIAVLSEGAKGSGATGPSEDAGSRDSAAGPLGRSASPIVIDLDTAEASIQQKALTYDRDGDDHYDAISAFIKSVRGSDPDAAVYWLARMLVAGEDPLFVARRIAILASEDIGNADPRGLSVAAACYDIVHRIGLPEARITLAQATIYLATAPKSNASYAAIKAAEQDVKQQRTVPVPKKLRSAPNRKDGTYAYAHDSDTGFVDQDYLGVDKTYYVPTGRGYEKRIADFLQWIDQQRGITPPPGPPPAAADPN
jgi:putative ATPase